MVRYQWKGCFHWLQKTSQSIRRVVIGLEAHGDHCQHATTRAATPRKRAKKKKLETCFRVDTIQKIQSCLHFSSRVYMLSTRRKCHLADRDRVYHHGDHRLLVILTRCIDWKTSESRRKPSLEPTAMRGDSEGVSSRRQEADECIMAYLGFLQAVLAQPWLVRTASTSWTTCARLFVLFFQLAVDFGS